MPSASGLAHEGDESRCVGDRRDVTLLAERDPPRIAAHFDGWRACGRRCRRWGRRGVEGIERVAMAPRTRCRAQSVVPSGGRQESHGQRRARPARGRCRTPLQTDAGCDRSAGLSRERAYAAGPRRCICNSRSSARADPLTGREPRVRLARQLTDRCAWKKRRSRSAQSSASRPPTTSGRWLRRGWRRRSYTEPAMPARRSGVP
jgi:hypothetical protein